ncbi:hypothetical protein NST86_31810 [Bacillus sp. FSL L8-0199]|uniref:hypothetical protein n=1 Tax=Bacillus TaxID=1386 RepID=UPI000A3C0121|nr:hypothetical protein [Bacillus thuringiensis]OUB29894.1 hypothetical protein BK739_10455 [Bacillus thuringiensis serovar pirenaica]
MAQTIRMYLPKQKTGWKFLNWNFIGETMPTYPVVHISACEARLYDDSLGTDLQTIELVKGDASIYATSVVPSINSDGTLHVDFLLVVDWDHELNVACDITLFDTPDGGLIVGGRG